MCDCRLQGLDVGSWFSWPQEFEHSHVRHIVSYLRFALPVGCWSFRFGIRMPLDFMFWTIDIDSSRLCMFNVNIVCWDVYILDVDLGTAWAGGGSGRINSPQHSGCRFGFCLSNLN